MNGSDLGGVISAVIVVSTTIAIVAIGLAVTGCGADGGCTVVGVGIETRHLGMTTTASGLLISAIALSGRGRRGIRPI